MEHFTRKRIFSLLMHIHCVDAFLCSQSLLTFLCHRFWTHFRATSSPKMQKRFVGTVQKYAEGAAKQVASREKNGFPNIKEFIFNRQSVSGVEVCTQSVGCYILKLHVLTGLLYHRRCLRLSNTASKSKYLIVHTIIRHCNISVTP